MPNCGGYSCRSDKLLAGGLCRVLFWHHQSCLRVCHLVRLLQCPTAAPFPFPSMHFSDLPLLPSEWGLWHSLDNEPMEMSPELSVQVSVRAREGFFFFFFTVPYLFSIQTYRLPLQPPTSRLATHLGSERLNESRQNCTAFLTHRKIMHFNGIAGQFISLVCKMLMVNVIW